MKIHSVCDKEFAQYGRVLTELDTKELISSFVSSSVRTLPYCANSLSQTL